MKRRARFDEILDRPEVRAELERFKHLFCVAMDLDYGEDPAAYEHAAYDARAVAFRIVDRIRSDTRNSMLPGRPLYHYVINRAFAEMVAPIASEDDVKQVELPVHLPPGRPPGTREPKRERVVEALRNQPDLHNYQVADRARRWGAWKPHHEDNPANQRRRIKRLRKDADR
jgi:hypothetical protein